MKRHRILAAILILAMCASLCACGAQKTYLVTFDGDGGRLVSAQKVQTVTAGESAVAPVFEKDGYAFAGWSEDFSSVNADITVTALWEKLCRVSFDGDGGTLISGEAVQTVKSGESAMAPVFEKEGYVFSGWSESFDEIISDISVSAVWEKLISVGFEPAGGAVVSGSLSQELLSGEMPEAPVLEREGYTFAGWNEEPAPAAQDVVYTALWQINSLSARGVYKVISPSMVEILTYDSRGECFSIGSGFFIDSEGTVLTNHHVIEGGYAASASTYDGEESAVLEVIGYDADIDLAILKTAFSESIPVVFAEESPEMGDTIYALGSALGETNTFTTGIVSNPKRVKDGVEYIQIDAALSPGNSGGPLINEYGQVLGINSWQYVDGQNMNFAIAIAELDNIDRSSPITMEQFGIGSAGGSTSLSGGTVENENGQTVVRTGDNGEAVYDFADYIECENNDSTALANALHEGLITAGYVDPDDIDVYSFTLEKTAKVKVSAMTYWGDDDPYFIAVLTDEYGDIVTNHVGSKCVFEFNEENETWELSVILSAGTYCVAIMLDSGYPYDVGCYYLAGYTK